MKIGMIVSAKSRSVAPRGASHHPAFASALYLVVELVPVSLVLLKVVRILRMCETRMK